MTPLWRAWLTVPEERTAAAERVFEGWADAVSVFELSPADRPLPDEGGRGEGWANELWLAEVCVVEGLAAAPPDAGDLARRAAEENLPAPETAPLAERDWAAESNAGLPLRRVGRIAVGDPGAPLPPGSRAPRHCRRDRVRHRRARHHGGMPCRTRPPSLPDGAWSAAARRARPRHGHGHLAFAAVRLWPGVRVAASDIDPAAIALFARNARTNGLRLAAVRADGPAHPALNARAPYDVIVANLLYRPLLRLAPGIARCAAPGGTVIMSGILERQELPLRVALRRHGLSFLRSRRRDGWSTIEAARPRRRPPSRWNGCRQGPFRL